MKQLMVFVGILAILGLAGMSYMSNLSNNAVDIAQAQAAIESARAARDASKGVQILAWGLSATSAINSVIILVLLLICLCLVVLLVYHIVKSGQQKKQPWVPGPNANFGRADRPQLPRPQAAPTAQDLLNAMLYQQLMQTGRLPVPQVREESPDESREYTHESEGEWEW